MCVSLVGTRKRMRRRYVDGSGFEMCPMKDLRIARCRSSAISLCTVSSYLHIVHSPLHSITVRHVTDRFVPLCRHSLSHSADTVCATLPTHFVPLCRHSLCHSADTVCATLPTEFEPLCRHSSPLSGFLTPGHGILRKRPSDRSVAANTSTVNKQLRTAVKGRSSIFRVAREGFTAPHSYERFTATGTVFETWNVERREPAEVRVTEQSFKRINKLQVTLSGRTAGQN
jgi:hypothetical protein